MDLRIGYARAVNDRLVVAGEQPARFAKLGDPHRPEIFLEEGARLIALERPGPRHPLADILESASNRSRIAELVLPVEHLAAGLERRESRAVIVALPAVELGPLDRLKLAIRDLQGINGGLAAGLIKRHHVKRHYADEPHRGCANPPDRKTSTRSTRAH